MGDEGRCIGKMVVAFVSKRCCIRWNATPYKTKATPGIPPIRVREAPGGLNRPYLHTDVYAGWGAAFRRTCRAIGWAKGRFSV